MRTGELSVLVMNLDMGACIYSGGVFRSAHVAAETGGVWTDWPAQTCGATGHDSAQT